MTAKEQLRQRVEALSEEQAAAALQLLEQRAPVLASEKGYPDVFPRRPGRPATTAEFAKQFDDLPTDDDS
ncbi:MAG TPA: hypothetical protein VGH56_09465 [Solirubrobacteraceae bacterium]